EVDGVLLLGLVLVVKDNIREPAIAFHAAHVLDLVKDEMEVGIEFRVAEHEGAVLGPLVDHLLDRGVDVILGEAFGRAAHGWSGTLAGCRRRRSYRWSICRGMVVGHHWSRSSEALRHGTRSGV